MYGDGIIRVHWDNVKQKVEWQPILPEHFLCKWHPFNPDIMTECIIFQNLPRDIAYELYQSRGDDSIGQYDGHDTSYSFATVWERWTPYTYQLWVDNDEVISQVNPYATVKGKDVVPGFIPIIHVPNLKVNGEFYGFADFEAAEPIQDEFNRRLSDMGDILNNHAHPITKLFGFMSDTPDLPVGPDAVWEMPKGKELQDAEYLEYKGSGMEKAMDYLEYLKTLLFMTASVTEVAFGQHHGSQRSGVSLANQMLPITERALEKRLIWEYVLATLIKMSTKIYEEMRLLQSNKNLPVLPFTSDDLENYDIRPVWFPMLPKDHLAEIQENISLKQNQLRSIKGALIDLGDENPDQTRKEIMQDLADLVKLGIQVQAGGKNSDQGSGGSPDNANSADMNGSDKA
jgi:hypothetical protein